MSCGRCCSNPPQAAASPSAETDPPHAQEESDAWPNPSGLLADVDQCCSGRKLLPMVGTNRSVVPSSYCNHCTFTNYLQISQKFRLPAHPRFGSIEPAALIGRLRAIACRCQIAWP